MQHRQAIREIGRSVIDIESTMIRSLMDRIDQKFVDACELLLTCKSKVIVMGMGKSGHIGKKIAATFASTGTPSFFIHPGEAKHGDFGMMTVDDILVAISNSGETEEVLAIMPFIKKLGINVISLTGNPQSSLAKAATINLDVSVSKEACPLGLAPTSSTTATLVMGDALAISLLQCRGFTAEDFAKSHPGGSLGKKLLLSVDELMHKDNNMPSVDQHVFLKTALVEMNEKKLGMTTIVNENLQLVGIFTDGDLRRALDSQTDIHQTPVHAVMNPEPKVIAPNTLAVQALRMMEASKITALIVTNEKHQPLGVLHLHDILRAGVI